MKYLSFLLFVATVAFCFFAHALYQNTGAIDILGIVASTSAITALLLGMEE